MLMPDLKDLRKTALEENPKDLDKHFRVFCVFFLQLCF